MKINKKIIILVAIFAFGFIYLYSNMPLSITEYYNGVTYSEELNIEEEVLIQLYGKGYGNLFGANTFIGTVTMGNAEYKIELKGDKVYTGKVINHESNKEVGTIYVSENFNSFYFKASDSDFVVAGPAATKEEAMKVANAFTESK